MGFKPTTKVYEVEYEDYPGLEVKCHGASVGELTDLGKLPFGAKLKVEDQTKVFKFFAARLITWNVEHPDLIPAAADAEGNCVRCGLEPGALLPTDVEHMFCLDLGFMLNLIFGWVSSIVVLSVPKGMSLPNGASDSQEALMKELGNLASPLTLPVQS